MCADGLVLQGALKCRTLCRGARSGRVTSSFPPSPAAPFVGGDPIGLTKKQFRRSMKGDKAAEAKPHHISIPPKDAIAIVPPKKVIKALYDYNPPANDPEAGYLGFTAGDFLHVVGRENDEDWYEACNPLQGTRGLVPAKYFEIIGKEVRNSGSSTTTSASRSQPSAGHDSGYGEFRGAAAGGPVAGMGDIPRVGRMSKAMKGAGAMVFGIVMYDFKAERPDELEAKEGEAIIVIAQSNPEWFVAKPITRLGGPGLIPVSFIEIRDVTTGQPVADALEAVQRAGVPKVEEWKKAAAEYKNGSIPLGKLEPNTQSIAQGMDRLSLGGRTLTGESNGYQSHSRTGSGAHQTGNYRSIEPGLLAPVRASVPRYCFADDIFWFIVECEMEDGRHWELSRLYQDFYDLQIKLIQEYPLEAGNVKGVERSLPYMPGPVTYVTDNISNGRRANLDDYIKNLLKLGPHITGGQLVRKFFQPRKGDYEIDPDAPAGDMGGDPSFRYSGNSQASADRNGGYGNPGNPYGTPAVVAPPPQQGSPYHQQPSLQSPPHQNQHYRQTSNSELGVPPPMLRQNSSLTQASVSSGGTGGAGAASTNTGTGTGAPTAFKIKVWFEEDNCVVIRMPPTFRFQDLFRKLRDRRAMEKSAARERERERNGGGGGRDSGGSEDEDDEGELVIEYRDELDGQYYRIDNDEDLNVAVERNPKLTLSVSSMR
ncbi:hypothetical protein BDY21DRAFT_153727 [Lineolata rhizophorae]|uniref:Scaffold protein Scd2 n=1 Tax=Lineolata rhizophorae TaxID=578093 RepID=A0A6A6NN34_9PEZI|nr:hypothetical protein BDY21DRAFT_153727 [Lineolata rhizophorae]